MLKVNNQMGLSYRELMVATPGLRAGICGIRGYDETVGRKPKPEFTFSLPQEVQLKLT